MKTIIFLVLLHAVCLICVVPRGYDKVNVTISDGQDTTSVNLKRAVSLLNVHFGPFVVQKLDRDGRAAFYVGYDFQDAESCRRLSTKTSVIKNDSLDTFVNNRPCERTKIH